MTLFHKGSSIADRVTDRVTDVTSLGAVSSPFWLDTFMQISAFFGAILPIVGTIWIVYQLIEHVIKNREDGNREGRAELKQELCDELKKDDHDGV